MTTVLQGYTIKEKYSILIFYGQMYLIQRLLIKKCFLFTVESVFSRKAVHNLVEKFSQGRSKVENNTLPGAEVAETTVKKILSVSKFVIL
jgi:hypothetical protein